MSSYMSCVMSATNALCHVVFLPAHQLFSSAWMKNAILIIVFTYSTSMFKLKVLNKNKWIEPDTVLFVESVFIQSCHILQLRLRFTHHWFNCVITVLVGDCCSVTFSSSGFCSGCVDRGQMFCSDTPVVCWVSLVSHVYPLNRDFPNGVCEEPDGGTNFGKGDISPL